MHGGDEMWMFCSCEHQSIFSQSMLLPSTLPIVNIASEGCAFLEVTSWRHSIIRNICEEFK